MALLSLLTVVLLAVTACDASPVSRIVGGEPTTISRFPSVTQVEFLGTASGIWTQSCAASVLNSNYVLSAAHCFHGIFYAPENRRIRAGSTYRNTGGLVVNVAIAFNHPTYGLNDMNGDITVVRLQTPLQLGPSIQQAVIVVQGYQVPPDSITGIVGWGATEIGGIPSSELRFTTTRTVYRGTCVDLYKNLTISRNVTENMLCTRSWSEDRGDACQGDFGGPLYFANVLVGILSWGHSCGELPTVSTAVSSYTEWIVGIVV